MCVNTTVRMAEDLGFEVFVVEDACATFDRVGPDGVLRRAEDIHAYALTDLHGEFCTVIKASDVQGLLGSSRWFSKFRRLGRPLFPCRSNLRQTRSADGPVLFSW